MALASFLRRNPASIDNARLLLKQFDYIVLGSGIAGLTFALKVAPHGKVAIITKKNRAESNTNYAQGGIAAVTSKEDSVEMHVRDTLVAGAGLRCKAKTSFAPSCRKAPRASPKLIDLGMKFSGARNSRASRRARTGSPGKEGGHSKRRIAPRQGCRPSARSSAPCSLPSPRSRTSKFTRIISRSI